MSLVIKEIDFADDPQLLALCKTLPDHAVEKLLLLKERDAKATAWSDTKQARLAPIHDQRHLLAREIRRYESNRGRGDWDNDDEKALTALRKRHDQCTAKMVEVQNEARPSDFSIERASEYLWNKRGARYTDARVRVKVAKNTELDTLAAVRAEIDRLTQELSAAQRSPVPYELALNRAYADIDRLAAGGTVDFLRAAKLVPVPKGEVQGHIGWPRTGFDTGSQYVEIIDAPALLASFLGDALKKRAKAELDAFYKSRFSYANQADRVAAIAAAEAALLATERREEAIVEVCEARKVDVQRRPKANTLAVLGIAPVEK